MSVLIKGMDIPKSCQHCPCCTEVDSLDHEAICAVWGDEIYDMAAGRINDCPLVEVQTPHGNLIDKDTVIKNMLKAPISNTTYCVSAKDIINAPVIIEAEE